MSGQWESAEERETTRTVTRRAIWRLRVFGWVVVAAAAVAAVIGGALAALLLQDAFGLPFEASWVGASLLLFFVPALIAMRKWRSQ